jgi:hypothetical protein
MALCRMCNKLIQRRRADAEFCSDAHKQKMYRRNCRARLLRDASRNTVSRNAGKQTGDSFVLRNKRFEPRPLKRAPERETSRAPEPGSRCSLACRLEHHRDQNLIRAQQAELGRKDETIRTVRQDNHELVIRNRRLSSEKKAMSKRRLAARLLADRKKLDAAYGEIRDLKAQVCYVQGRYREAIPAIRALMPARTAGLCELPVGGLSYDPSSVASVPRMLDAVSIRGERIRRGIEDADYGDCGAVAGSGGDYPRGREW